MEACRPGHRPPGWWLFERRERPPQDGPAEVARLIQIEQLSDAEMRELEVKGDESILKAAQAALAGSWRHKEDKPSAEEALWWRGAGVKR
jgi:hypothetical protein